jgi:hypothetical protein
MSTKFLVLRDLILDHSGFDLLIETQPIFIYSTLSEIDEDDCSYTEYKDISLPEISYSHNYQYYSYADRHASSIIQEVYIIEIERTTESEAFFNSNYILPWK